MSTGTSAGRVFVGAVELVPEVVTSLDGTAAPGRGEPGAADRTRLDRSYSRAAPAGSLPGEPVPVPLRVGLDRHRLGGADVVVRLLDRLDRLREQPGGL